MMLLTWQVAQPICAKSPSPVRGAAVRARAASRDIDHFVCDDLESLLYVVNLGTIPLHIYAARVGTDRADWCIIDLDPKEAPFEWVVRLARATNELCDEIGLPSFCKTSGQKGLHVLIPLAQQCTQQRCDGAVRPGCEP